MPRVLLRDQGQAPGDRPQAARAGGQAGAALAGARYKVTDCLGPCGQGNVVVVRAKGLTRWFRRMNDEAGTAALLDHLAVTGTVSGLPAALDRHVMGGREGKKP